MTATPARPTAFSTARTLATAARVLRQLRHDPRTIALLLLVPCVMITLLRYVFDGSPGTFDAIGASLLGIFPLITMFLVTSIATLRERTSGTLERLLALPLGKADLIMRLRPRLRRPRGGPVGARHRALRLAPGPRRHGLPVAAAPGRRPRRAARHRPRPLRLGLRRLRVPGRAVHAGW